LFERRKLDAIINAQGVSEDAIQRCDGLVQLFVEICGFRYSVFQVLLFREPVSFSSIADLLIPSHACLPFKLPRLR